MSGPARAGDVGRVGGAPVPGSARRAALCLAVLVALVTAAPEFVGHDPGRLAGRALQAPLAVVSAGDSMPSALPADARRAWLGTDPLGRDVFVRIVHGSRISVGLAACATLVALVVGVIIGATAAASGRLVDAALMRLSELIFVLPGLYVLLAVRAALPLVVTATTLFVVSTTVLGVLGAPLVARAVRAVLRNERARDFVAAAVATGASWPRVVARHLVPQAAPVIVAQALVLFPACLLAEATLSFAGLGFPSDCPSLGTLLQDATSVRALDSAPWLLAPVAAMALTVWVANQLADSLTGH